MPKEKDDSLIVGLDIGTTKIVTLVGELKKDGNIEIIGSGTHPSQGLKRGVVANIEATVQSIQKAIEEAELMVGCQINSVYAGIAGSHIRSFNSQGVIAIRDSEVTRADVHRVIDAAKTIPISPEQRILHVLPQEYIIDNQEDIREPIGMSGMHLKVKVHIVSGAVSAVQNIIKCVQHCNLEVENIVLEPIASGYSVLTPDEKDLGVCVIDIGGGTTDIAIFSGGAIRHTAVIAIGGNQVTNDIALTLRTPTKEAEKIKIEHGSASTKMVDASENIKIPNIAGSEFRTLPKQTLTEVIAARYEELFSLVFDEIQRHRFKDFISSGIVLTGGASMINGIQELAESIFGLPVRVGAPQHINGLTDTLRTPIYSTATGLLLYAKKMTEEGRPSPIRSGSLKGIWARMCNWFQGNF